MLRPALAALAALLFLPGALALPAPAITFIPDTISINSSFLVLANPQSSLASRVTWLVKLPSPVPTYGLFPKAGPVWACYFSNADPAASCGPNPFSLTSAQAGVPIEIQVDSVDAAGNAGNTTTVSVNVGGVTLSPSLTPDPQDPQIFHTIVYTSTTLSTMTYQAYFAANLSAIPGYAGGLTFMAPPFGFVANITLPGPGDYFIAFKGSSGSDTGGGVAKVNIGGQGVPGQAQNATAYILSADAVKFNAVAQLGQALPPKSYTITNTGPANVSGLTVSVNPPELSPYFTVKLVSNAIPPNGNTQFLFTVSPLQAGISLKASASLLSNGTKIGEIPIDVNVSVLGSIQPVAPAGGQLTAEPASWIAAGLVGQPITTDITIRNPGPGPAANITVSSAGLEGIQSIPPATIPAGGSGTLKLTLNPASSGPVSGAVTLSSSGGSVSLAVAGDFYQDISGTISNESDAFDSFVFELPSGQSSALSTDTDTIKSLFAAAASDFSAGRYREATQEYIEAHAKAELLKSVLSSDLDNGETEPATTDGTGLPILPLLIAIVAVLGAVSFFLVRKRGKKGGEMEEEFEEDEPPEAEADEER